MEKHRFLPCFFEGNPFFFPKAIILLAVLFPAGYNLPAQSVRDSLEKALPSLQGRDRAEAQMKLSWEYRLSDKDKALRFGEESLQWGKAAGDSAIIASALNGIAETWLNFGDFDKAEQLTQEELTYLNPNIPNTNFLGALTRLGTIQYRRGKLEEALEYQLKVQRWADQIKADDLIGVSSINVGLTYMDLKQHNEALRYFYTSLEAFRNMNHKIGIGACYVNIAETLRNLKQYSAALDTAIQGETLLLESGNTVHLAYLYGSMAKIYGSLNDPSNRLTFSKKGLDLARTNQDDFAIAINLLGMGRGYLETGDLENAEKNLQESLALTRKMGDKSLTIESYAHLRDLHLLRRDFAEASMFDEKYNSGLDSVFNAKMADKTADAQIRYETEQKEAEISRQQLGLLRQRTWIISLALGLMAFVVFGYLFYNRYRLRKKAELDAAVIREQRLGLNAVIEAQEIERKRIAKDLHDGIAQEMAAIRMGFSALQRRLVGVAPEEASNIGVLAQQLDESCTEVRSISHVMMPPTLEQQGLASSLELLLRNALPADSGLKYEFEFHNLPERIDDKVSLGLYRIAQELLNNIIKHADAQRVVVMLYKAGQHLVLHVEDDGKGFIPDQVRTKGSMGLLNIFSRASAFGGVFQIMPGDPKGTVATVRAPV